MSVDVQEQIEDIDRTINSMRKKLVFLAVWIFLCGVSACAGFQMFFQDLKGLDGYIEYLRNNWVDLSPVVGAMGLSINVIIAVWAYFQLKDYIAMRERLVILMAKAVELMEKQKELRNAQGS